MQFSVYGRPASSGADHFRRAQADHLYYRIPRLSPTLEDAGMSRAYDLEEAVRQWRLLALHFLD